MKERERQKQKEKRKNRKRKEKEHQVPFFKLPNYFSTPVIHQTPPFFCDKVIKKPTKKLKNRTKTTTTKS